MDVAGVPWLEIPMTFSELVRLLEANGFNMLKEKGSGGPGP